MCAACAVIERVKVIVCNQNQNRATKKAEANPQREDFHGKLNEKHEI